ncbi:MAG: PVC-type heme-binding CxxCH protein [Balneolales bacterium]
MFPCKASCLIVFCTQMLLLPGCKPPWPFTPEVGQFVDIYAETGGEKLENWVRDEKVRGPEQTLASFKAIGGLNMELVVSEPLVTQPIDIHFDVRGRLWVVQYKQYPFPAGVTITSYDQYLRAGFDGIPEAPPNHIHGADKITVFEDTSGDGIFDSHKEVISGLNITTSVLTGGGGVWVMTPPYLLFYPDHSGDGLPDGDPEVRLEGFGLEDTHSLASSLTWGPDGWLYGVNGSTSTGRVRGIRYLGQAVWRYHPGRDEFELFSEGGGNPWTLSFDSKGRAFSGHNGGDSRGFHWVQGGRYDKNWPKHGPLTRPHSFGSFPTMEHTGYPDRFAMTFTLYEEGRLPGYEGQLISGMAMTNRVQASRLVGDGSTFASVDTDSLVMTGDRSFRPVDTKPGPDGAVYFADWCDIRMDHVDPRDTWNKSCGRIWRLQPDDYQPVAPFDLASLSGEELADLLDDERKWYREQARRLLGERKEYSLVDRLQRQALEERGQLALESLWTVNLIDGIDPDWALRLMDHPDAGIRSWIVRLLGDTGEVTAPLLQHMVRLARTDPDLGVRSQLASTARRLGVSEALSLLRELISRGDNMDDKHIPLLIWWALEEKMTSDGEAVMSWLGDSELWQMPLFAEYMAERIARRLTAEQGDTLFYTRIDPHENWMEYARYPRSRMPGNKGDYTGWMSNYTPEVSKRNLTRLASLLEMGTVTDYSDRLLAGMEAGLGQGPASLPAPERLLAVMDRWWNERPQMGTFLAVASKLGYPPAVERVSAMAERMDTDDMASPGEGRALFLTHCSLCHQADGSGMERLATPLQNSQWVLGPDKLLIRIVLNGFQEEMTMPPMGTLNDGELAAILTYIRSAWGHEAGAVAPQTIKQIRAESEGRSAMWTRQELTSIGSE